VLLPAPGGSLDASNVEVAVPPTVAIGNARAAIDKPVVVNGDLNGGSSLVVCNEPSGGTRFMLGRGPIGAVSRRCG
jgi:hypothetical protein